MTLNELKELKKELLERFKDEVVHMEIREWNDKVYLEFELEVKINDKSFHS